MVISYLRLSEQAEQLTAFNKVHDHVQILRILPCSPQCNEEWMSAPLQHLALIVGMLDLLHLDNLRLLQHLDGVVPLIMLGLHQVDSAEGACA